MGTTALRFRLSSRMYETNVVILHTEHIHIECDEHLPRTTEWWILININIQICGSFDSMIGIMVTESLFHLAQHEHSIPDTQKKHNNVPFIAIGSDGKQNQHRVEIKIHFPVKRQHNIYNSIMLLLLSNYMMNGYRKTIDVICYNSKFGPSFIILLRLFFCLLLLLLSSIWTRMNGICHILNLATAPCFILSTFWKNNFVCMRHDGVRRTLYFMCWSNGKGNTGSHRIGHIRHIRHDTHTHIHIHRKWILASFNLAVGYNGWDGFDFWRSNEYNNYAVRCWYRTAKWQADRYRDAGRGRMFDFKDRLDRIMRKEKMI